MATVSPGKLVHGGASAARHRLIGRNLRTLESRERVQRRERGGERDAGAARQGHQAARRSLERPGVDIGHHQRHALLRCETSMSCR